MGVRVFQQEQGTFVIRFDKLHAMMILFMIIIRSNDISNHFRLYTLSTKIHFSLNSKDQTTKITVSP